MAVPILVEEKEFLTDSGGPGRQRGGLGLRMAFRGLDTFAGTTTASLWLHGQNVPPFGLQGGEPANAAHAYIDGRQLSREEVLSQTGALPLADPEMLVAFDTTGGGGFGPPEDRDPTLVWADVRDGLVSVEQAAKIYGVVLAPSTLEIDESATAAKREALRAARKQEKIQNR